MAIDITKETIIPIRRVPQWCEDHLGQRVHPSTVHRWRLRGARGVRLESLLIGGARVTSAESLSRFFAATTEAADGISGTPAPTSPAAGISEAEAYLDSET